jgi:hypothetical protein
MPALSSATAKNNNKTPLTPRVAGANPPLATTPLARRGPPRQDGGSTPIAQAPDLSTPVSSFLATNITPRSAKRISRVDSPGGTPTGTPAPELLRAVDGYNNGGLGLSGFDSTARRPTGPYSPVASDIGSQRDQAQPNPDAKFFFASDAKTAATQPLRPQPRTLQKKTSTSSFFYANGDSIPPPISSSASAVGSSTGDERSQPKFFHANGIPDLQPSPGHFFPPTGSSVGSPSHTPSPRLAGNPSIISQQQRPISPVKASPNVSFSALKNTPSLAAAVLPRPVPLGRGNSLPNSHSRQVSIELPPRPLSRERSVVGVQQTPINPGARRISIGSPLALPSPIAAMIPVTMAEPLSSPTESSASDEDDADSAMAEPLSPTKAGGSLEHMNELAANARRERKVLDLEITNSSLAAINRTLEREMRKQAAELRRYRRLSRSGRLSIVTTGSRASTGTLMAIGEDPQALSDMSEDEEDSEEESDLSSESDDIDEGALSPRAMAENDARHRKKDEKRLQLDLSKHQQLLVDSQKMNQSLKRCLGWTEALIAEGKKALAYNVRVSDVELGGRVLAPEEERDDDEREENLARISQTNDIVQGYHNTWGSIEKDDRDSGVENDPANAIEGTTRSFSDFST